MGRLLTHNAIGRYRHGDNHRHHHEQQQKLIDNVDLHTFSGIHFRAAYRKELNGHVRHTNPAHAFYALPRQEQHTKG